MGIFLIVIGLAGVIGGVLLGARVLRVRGWPTARATVVERGVGEPSQPTGGTRNARYVPKIRYTYEVGGVRYEGHELGLVQEAMTAEAAREVVDAIPDTVEVHYDPEDPSRAYIDTGSLTLPVVVGLGGLLLALGGLGALISGKEGSG